MKILQGKIPLRLALTAPFVGLIVLAVGLAGYVSFCNGRRAVDDAAAQVRAEITQRIQEQLHSFLNVPHQINQINADAMARGLLDAHDAEALECSFWVQIQAFESMTSVYFGNTAGGLIDSGREPATDSQYVIASPGFASGPLQKYAVDAQGNRTTLLATVPSFDARTRPWYIKAVEKRGPVWSPIYILSTGQDMAIAASRPVYDPDNALLGVVSVDIFLSHIGDFLRGLEVGQHGECFIMERSGLLIASSTDTKPFTDEAGPEPRRRLQANEIRDPIIRLAAAALSDRFGDNHRITTVQQAGFESDGIRYFLEVSPVQDARGLDWLACVVICEADFMSRIEAGNRQTLLLIAGALLLTLIIGLAGAKRIARPISGLHFAAQGLAKGQWPQTTDIVSSIREVSGLKLSFEEMTIQLHKTIESLEHEVAISTKVQAALRESEERWQFALEGAGDGVWDWNVQTDEVFFSQQWKAMLGFEDNEIANSLVEWEKRVHPDDLDRVYGEIDKHFSGDTPVYISEHRLKCKDETYKWVLDRGKVIHWTDDGKPLRMIGTHVDISERKRNATLLQAERDMGAAWSAAGSLQERLEICLRTAIQIASMDGGGFYVVDETDGGLALSVHQGFSVDFIHQVSRFSEDSSRVRLIRQGTPAYAKAEDLPGERRDVLLAEGIKSIAIVPLIFEGRAVGCLNVASRSMDHIPGYARSALERIARYASSFVAQEMEEEKTRQSQQDLDTLFNTVQDMLLILDDEGKIIHYNTVVTEKLGYPAEQLIGKPVLVIHPEDRQEEARAVVAAMLAGKTNTCPIPLQTRDGRLIPVETKVVRGHWKGRDAIIGICRDISERLELERRTLQIEKAESLGRMAGAIAHHFNNQLQAVMGNIEMATGDLPQSGGPFEALAEAMNAAHRAARVSGQMLTYLGLTPAERKPLDLSEACRLNLPMLEAAMPRNVVLETDLPTPGPALCANPNQMQQVLTHLVTNAWEAMSDAGGEIHLSVKTVHAKDIPALHRSPINWQAKEKIYACLEVRDSGPGISEQDMEKLFDPFFSTKFTGRGLGLPMVLGIVKAHGGCMVVDSRCGMPKSERGTRTGEDGGLRSDDGRRRTKVGVGGRVNAEPGTGNVELVGSVFRVFLPLCEEALPSPAEAGAKTSSELKGGGTALLIEDDPQVRKVGVRMLQHLGWKVLAARDGVEGVEMFLDRQEEIRFVLSDLTMPRMDGWETLSALRKVKPDVSVILASGYDEASVMSGDHDEWPQAFLGKPYSIEDLRVAIARVQEADDT